MIDPQFFEERMTHTRVVSWLYDQGFLELHKGTLRLSDKAAGYCMVALFLIAVCVAV